MTTAEIMRDAERMDLAQRRGTLLKVNLQRSATPVEIQRPMPTEIGNIELRKLVRQDREHCMREG